MAKYKDRYRVESARLPGWDYRAAGWYFVTLCTRDRVPFFGEIVDGKMVLSSIGRIVAEEWQRTPEIRSNVILDEWGVMPNHLHGILVIVASPNGVGTSHAAQTPHAVETPRAVKTPRRGVSTGAMPGRLTAGSLGAIIGQVKSVCTKRIRAAGYADFAWQACFHEHIIRNDESLQHIRNYINTNPAKWTEDRYFSA